MLAKSDFDSSSVCKRSLHFSSKHHSCPGKWSFPRSSIQLSGIQAASMAPPASIHPLTRRLLSIQRTPAQPEIAFRTVGSILGTPLPSQPEIKYLDIVSPQQCNADTRAAIEHLLHTCIPQWRWVCVSTGKLQKPGRTKSYRRAWTRVRKREIGCDGNVLIMVERETLGSVDVASERPFSELEVEERLRRAAGTPWWKRSKTLRQKLWKRPSVSQR